MEPWRQLDSQVILQDRWISLRADTCALPTGVVIAPYYVFEERDWVHTFARDADGNVLVVRQYRYAANAVCIELPGGVIEVGESPIDAVQRELREETGYVAGEWVKVGAVFANPARQTNTVHIFTARGVRREAAQTLDASEDMRVELVTPSEIKAMIGTGEFSQALHIASFYMAMEAMAKDG